MACIAFPSCDCVGFCKYGPTRTAQGALPPAYVPDWTARANHNRPCPYCNVRMDMHDPAIRPTRDHIVPRSRGGRNAIDNCMAVCWQCNQDKADALITEWHRYLVHNNDKRAIHVSDFIRKLKTRSCANATAPEP